MKVQFESTNPIATLRRHAVIVAVAGMLAASPVMAAKPDSAGGGNPHKKEQAGKHGNHSHHEKDHGGQASHGNKGNKGNNGAKVSVHFDDRRRTVIRDYYKNQFGRGNCPPGLAKKNNGCLPPGQAKKWAVGQRLPRDVIYYDLPRSLLRELGDAPAGHKYARVGADILLLSVGTGLVVDALADLNLL